MSLQKIRIGILDIELPVQSENTVPSALSITPTVSDIDLGPTTKLNNDINPPLNTADTYQFVIGFVGEDRVNGGYTVGFCSQGSGIVSIAEADNGIRISVPNASLPTYYDEAVCMAVFVKINSASKYQLCKLAYIDPEGDFNTIITHKPLRSAPKFNLSLLQSTDDTDETLGSRVGYGFTFEKIEPTTQEITERYAVTTVPVSPNNGPDFNVRTTVASGLEFNLLLNDIKNFVQAAGGHWAKYNDAAGDYLIEEGEFSLATAQAVLRGNRPVKVNYPPDGLGNAEVGLFLGLLSFNQQELTAAWSKSGTTPVRFVFEAAILDKLVTSQHAKVSYKKKQL